MSVLCHLCSPFGAVVERLQRIFMDANGEAARAVVAATQGGQRVATSAAEQLFDDDLDLRSAALRLGRRARLFVPLRVPSLKLRA